MAANDDDESTAVIVGVLAAIALGVTAVVYSGKSMNLPVHPKTVEVVEIVEVFEIAPVGEALAKVYFAVGSAALSEADKDVVAKTMAALEVNPNAIVLLSGFHDTSGDAQRNAELAKERAESVRDALVAGGVANDRVKFRKPESTLGSGNAEEGRRVEIRVQ